MIKFIFKVIWNLIILCLIFSGLIFASSQGWLIFGRSYGISNGPPYCNPCITAQSSLITPKVGSYIIYPNRDNESIMHQVYEDLNSHYLVQSFDGIDWHRSLVAKEDVTKVLLFKIYTFNRRNIYKACMAEVDKGYEANCEMIKWKCHKKLSSIYIQLL